MSKPLNYLLIFTALVLWLGCKEQKPDPNYLGVVNIVADIRAKGDFNVNVWLTRMKLNTRNVNIYGANAGQPSHDGHHQCITHTQKEEKEIDPVEYPYARRPIHHNPS